MLRNVQAVVFDWGGTLARVVRQEATRRPCAEAAAAFLQAQGLPLPDRAAAELHRRFLDATARAESPACLIELDTPALLSEWADAVGVALPNGDTRGALADAFWRPWVGCLDLLPGVEEALRRLRDAGYGLGLASNCAAAPACCRAELARLGIAALFDFTLFSSELGVKKPHPNLYDEAINRLSRAIGRHFEPAEVLFVGDTPRADVAGPQRCGMRTALVRTGNWGGGGEDADDLEAAPDLIVDSASELPTYLTDGPNRATQRHPGDQRHE